MTKEENIATLNEHLEHWKRLLSEKICSQSEGEKTIDALRNAIKALEQEPCGDCISRESVNDLVRELGNILNGTESRRDVSTVLTDILYLPPVTPQSKMGRWERDQFTNQPTCSACGYKVFGGQTSYCPNCGTKMQEVEG